MKTVSPIGSAKRNSPPAYKFIVSPLSFFSARVKSRVREFEFPVHGGFPNFVSLVERYAKGLVGGETLQDIHVVGNDGLPLAFLGKVGIPTGPGGFSPWEQRIVTMQGNHVLFVGKRFKKGNFIRGGRINQPEGLIGVTSENDFIEGLSGTIGEGKLDPILGTRYFLDSGIKPDAVAQLGDDFVDVGAGTSLEYAPYGPVGDLEHIVVFQKARYELHGKFSEPRSRTGPKGGPQRKEEALLEAISEPVGFQKLIDRLTPFGLLRGKFVKAHDVQSHFPMEQVGQVSEVTEQAPKGFPAVLEAELLRADGKPHSGILRLDSEQIEKPDEIRVVLLVEYDKAGIDLESSGLSGHFDRIDVTACFGCGLEESYLMIFFEKMSACETRNAGTNDGDFHE